MAGPILGFVKRKASEPLSRARNRPGQKAAKRLPEGNLSGWERGEAIGAVNAGLAVVLEETLGVPFGATSEITNVEPVDGGNVYTVNVDAPSENIAKARALIDSSTGFSSYLIDEYDIEDVEMINIRPVRDTHQIKVKVKT